MMEEMGEFVLKECWFVFYLCYNKCGIIVWLVGIFKCLVILGS